MLCYSLEIADPGDGIQGILKTLGRLREISFQADMVKNIKTLIIGHLLSIMALTR